MHPESTGSREPPEDSVDDSGIAASDSGKIAHEVIPLNELERRAILAALRSTGGNRTRTAELLNISIRTLRNKIHEYRAEGLEIESGRD
ncbi:MAG: helix-turn-helix domain-containing protein [Bryobacterales bacterium]|nr:helix-turn-helix domain-containing protein [Bryobacterales bacterium]